MFMGTFSHALDPKCRLFIPVKLRSKNETTIKKFIITQGLESCLYLYEPKSFKSLSERLVHLPLKNQEDARAFKRLLLAGAAEVELDPLGRILIPKSLVHYAQIKGDVVILGVGERIELWAKEKWKVYEMRAQGAFKRLGKHLEV